MKEQERNCEFTHESELLVAMLVALTNEFNSSHNKQIRQLTAKNYTSQTTDLINVLLAPASTSLFDCKFLANTKCT